MRHDNTPRAARTLDALRKIGYEFNAAVADIVDNSITAGATTVWIFFRRKEDEFRLRIVDNGHGMTAAGIREALRLGTDSSYEDGSLGKYGFGLKTASISQCRRLTVISRPNKESDYFGYTLDLDEIKETDKWEIVETPSKDVQEYIHRKMVPPGSGTSVLWEKIDRLSEDFNSFQRMGAADNWFGRVLDDLKMHLSMVFQRFLDSTARRNKRLTIWFNGEALAPWDPFCRQEANTRLLQEHIFMPREHGCTAAIKIVPYVLPSREGHGGFSSIEAWKAAKGPLQWNESQGYYVYREDRLIHYGGWLRTRARDEHTKLARVAIFFSADHDEAFDISVNKVHVKLPASLREYLVDRVNPEVIKAAQEVYRKEARRGDTGNRHRRSTKAVTTTAPTVMFDHNVIVQPDGRGQIEVHNPKGRFVLNPEHESSDLGLQRFEIRTGVVEDGALWKLIGTPDCGFAVILNCDHDFYRYAYENGKPNQAFVMLVDAVLCAMAYAEIRCGSTGTMGLFNEIRGTVSDFLRRWSQDASGSPVAISGGGNDNQQN